MAKRIKRGDKLFLRTVLILLGSTTFLSCKYSVSLTEVERKEIISEVTSMLSNYHQDVKKSGLMAELSYLDSSSDFFWVPPGYQGSLPYDSVVSILKRNAKQYKLVENIFDTLTIVPLSKDMAAYTGRLRSVMTDTSGNTETYLLAETGTVIKRNGSWKLQSGQTGVLSKEAADNVTQPSYNTGLSFFPGKWDFKIWFRENKSATPDIVAKWTLEKSLDKVECYTGKVEMDGTIFTREIIVFNSYENKYTRTVMTNSGVYVVLRTKGWNENKLIWLGSQYSSGQKTELKEEIERLTDEKFQAKFYQLRNNEWQLTQTEYLTRI